jgi:succinate dehydrogenase/fumarate reductase-like Fe-S protein
VNSVFRCSCMAGDVATVPKGIPKFTTAVEPIRRRLVAR